MDAALGDVVTVLTRLALTGLLVARDEAVLLLIVGLEIITLLRVAAGLGVVVAPFRFPSITIFPSCTCTSTHVLSTHSPYEGVAIKDVASGKKIIKIIFRMGRS